jgi:hypothetical protein
MYLGSRVCFSCASVDRLNHWCEPEECLVQGTACSCEVTANDLGHLIVRGLFNWYVRAQLQHEKQLDRKHLTVPYTCMVQ